MIIVSPYSKRLPSGKLSPKNYPYFREVIDYIGDEHFIQIGVDGEEQIASKFIRNLPLKDISRLVKECDVWVSVDNFLPHLANHLKKPGIVIWGPSDPKIFGYQQNINIVSPNNVFRSNQFDTWENCDYDKSMFPNPSIVIDAIKSVLPNMSL